MLVRHERTAGMASLEDSRPTESVTERLRQGLADAGLDCTCQEKANALLDDFDHEHALQRRAGSLADARRMRDAIVMVLALLGEIDEITPEEPDTSAFGELASLFDDIAEFALTGADRMRHVAPHETSPTA